MILAIALLAAQTAFAAENLSAVLKDGILQIRWTAQGSCVLTVYRDSWPVTVRNVDGASGGMSIPAAERGSYSVRLRTPGGCLTANAAGGEAPEPDIEPTQTPAVRPTITPVVKPTAAPTAAPTVIPAPTAAVSGGQSMTSLAAQVISEVNAERAKHGLAPLTVNSRLTGAACIRAREIVEKFSHTRPDGSGWSSVSPAALGENIAKGHNSAERVMAAWMSSDGHRKNILRESFGSIGVCALQVNGVIYWVQLFGK